MFIRKYTSLSWIAIAPLALLSLSGCDENDADTESISSKLVKIVSPIPVQRGLDISLPAEVKSANAAVLSFKVAGRVSELLVKEGQTVKAGTVLARLDQKDFLPNIAAAEAVFREAEAAFQRVKTLFERSVASQAQLDIQASSLKTAEANLEVAKNTLNDSIVTAPFDGIVSKVDVELFQNVQALQPVFSLQAEGNFEAIADIPAAVVARYPSYENLKAAIRFDILPDVSLSAEFSRIATEATQATQTYRARFEFKPPTEIIILPGMDANVQLTAGIRGREKNNTFSLPASAISSDGDRKFVWIVREDMKVERQQVELDDSYGDMLTVQQGLQGNERIVAVGVAFLREGMLVREWKSGIGN